MQVKRKGKYVPESRQRNYIRLKSVFPVEFRKSDSSHVRPEGPWHQGYTSNIGKGGLCLEVLATGGCPALSDISSKALFELRVHIPLLNPPVKVIAELSWSEKDEKEDPPRYKLGLNYQSVDQADMKRLMVYARRLRFFSTGVMALFLLVISILLVMMVFYR